MDHFARLEAQRNPPFPFRLALHALLCLALLLATGCQTTRFYRQAAVGQWEMFTQRETISKVIRESPPDSPLPAQLLLVQELLHFAETELSLPTGRQFQTYVALDRPFVVWNVEAAPEFSLESKSWWYPLLGHPEYRGYFRPEMATEYAAQLAAQGYDVFVGGVPAYSTLGWFNDPVISTFIDYPEEDLAELLFHELAHQRLFVAGDTDFNEAYATAVGREGVRRWIAQRRDEVALNRFVERRSRDDEVISLILRERDELKQLYIKAESVSDADRREAKRAIIDSLRGDYESLKLDWVDYRTFDAFMAAPINNAQLNAIDTYFHLVPGFEAILESTEGNLPAFYSVVESTEHLNNDERRQFLTDWSNNSGY